jgi:hypothetical protein
MARSLEYRGSFWVRYLPGTLLVIVGFFFSADSELFLFGAAVFILFYHYFFSVSVPPVLLFIFFFQWFFNQGQLINSLIAGNKLAESFSPSGSINSVVFLSMLGTASFFLGMLIFVRKVPRISFEELKAFLLTIDVKRLLIVYLGFYALMIMGGGFVWLFLGIAQALYMFSIFRWSVFFLLFLTVFAQNRYKLVLLILILADFLLGFLSFWASFKDVVYVSFIAYWIFYFRTSILWRWTLPAMVLFMIYVGSLWSIIKQDYRNFLNRGTGAQVVYVGRGEALDRFVELASNADETDLGMGFDQLVVRLSWVGAFNRVYNHVPSHVPFEEGELWAQGITRPFMPRLLFPDKTILSDSKQLNKYSGLEVDEKNTSVSLSAIAGSYVDFGSVWMHLPLFLFGVFCGWVYKKVFDWSTYPAIAHALSVPLIFVVNINEQSIARIVASVVLYFVVVWAVSKVIKPMLRYIRPMPEFRPARLI